MTNDPYSNPLKVIEGIFDGESLWGEDNKIYPVASNYASKSKLVEGDRLKLYLQYDGSFVFKQVHPVERKRIIGTITPDMKVKTEDGLYKILTASLTYFKAEPGDDVVISLPVYGSPTWAALENIIKMSNHDREF